MAICTLVETVLATDTDDNVKDGLADFVRVKIST